MRLSIRMLALLVPAACAAAAWGAAQDPYIGYVYPAGGQQGTTFRVTIGGQRLQNVNQVYFSGSGIHARVLGYEGPQGPLNKLQQDELKRRLLEIRAQRLGPQASNKFAQKKAKSREPADNSTATRTPTVQPKVTLPDLPELRNLEQQSNQQLLALADRFVNPQKRPKPPIAEQVTLEVTIDPDAAAVDRDIRLRTLAGLSNPLVFQVGKIPEARGGGRYEDPVPSSLHAPIVLNGQIMPGEVDKWPLQLRAGQKLIVAVQARKLIPYLADAVPGWFQAAVSIKDADGRELAYDDDCGYVPDPALMFQVPRDGDYTVEIHDALYRGREDFVYRVDIGDEATMKPLFLLGMRGGVPVASSHPNWSLCRKLAEDHFKATDTKMPVIDEREPNDTGQKSMPITLPTVVSGCISAPGDRDVFSISGQAGDTIVAEVFARRMGSPVDSLIRMIDTSGRVVAMNDDHPDPESGLFTHHADSYVSAKLPKAGRYFVQVSDAQGHGGTDYRYYLRISAPQPDFALRVTPSCLNMTAGRATTATIYAIRKDGWDGDIALSLKDEPGFSIDGAVMPKGRDHIRITITPRSVQQTATLHLQGSAKIDGKTITRSAVPAEDMMQAFAYHHLVPAQQLLATVKRGFGISVTSHMSKGDRLAIPSGGTAQLSFTMRGAPNLRPKLELSDPPPGVTLQDVREDPRGVTLTLKADNAHAGYADNLIFEVFSEVNRKGGSGSAAQKQRVSAGFLPAVPFQIIER